MYILDNLSLRSTYYRYHDFPLCLVQQDFYVSFVCFSLYMLQFHLNLLLCVLQTPWSVDFSCSIDHSRSLASTDLHSRLCGLIFYYYIQMGNDITPWRMSVGLFYTKAYGIFTRKTIGKLTFRFCLKAYIGSELSCSFPYVIYKQPLLSLYMFSCLEILRKTLAL